MQVLWKNQIELPMKYFDTSHRSEESVNEMLRLQMLENRRIQQINTLKRMMHGSRHQSA